MKIRRAVSVGIGVGLLATTLSTLPDPAFGADAGAFTASKTITRNHLVDGHDDAVDTRNFSVSVSETRGLRDRQGLQVSWSGAHPTGGLVADQNAATAAQEEYPVVLLQCRGVDSTSAPLKDQLTPNTCWVQTAGERFVATNRLAFPPWRVDRYAPPAERTAIIGAPDPRPTTCPGPSLAERWLPFLAANNAVYYGGPTGNGCAGLPPEASASSLSGYPSNETYGVTGSDGKGSAIFEVWDAENNASLGCSDQVKCALVVVPIMGISCDVTSAGLPADDRPQPGQEADDAWTECSRTGRYAPGDLNAFPPQGDAAVTGSLWFNASNWRNRITVPLTFNQPGNVCDLVGGNAPLDLYGSELMAQATTQWAPAFCLKKDSFSFRHVQTGEPPARTLLASGSINGALVSDAPETPYPRPVVNAPVAITGFAIAYQADDNSGRRVATLRLTPRLLAKLLTMSYPAVVDVKNNYTPLAGNPLDITEDPEFQALNPDVPVTTQTQSAATLSSLSGESDVVRALSSYIKADPDAAAWLKGKPDPWGMVVNPNYKGIVLPVDQWPLSDTFTLQFNDSGTNPCLFDNPVPFLPLVAAPLSRMFAIAQNMQYSISSSTTRCFRPDFTSSAGERLTALGRETPGHRFLLGVVSLADASRYQLPAASLLTHVSSTSALKFTSSAGRTFMPPTSTSLRAAVSQFKPDAKTGTWPVDFAALRTKASQGYPGTEVVYAAIPTRGLKAEDAKDYATWLRFAAGPGQVPGPSFGQLPDGYLPMTQANGLGGLSAYTLHAADAVAAQRGEVPALIPVAAPASSAPVSRSGQVSSGGTGTISGPTVEGVSRQATPPAVRAITAAPQLAPSAQSIATKTVFSALAGRLLPLLLLIGVAVGGVALLANRYRVRTAK